MIEESNLKTYLSISPRKFEIYLFDIINFKYLYQREITIENSFASIDLNILSKFLEDNVFNIEKLIGKFLNNICLIIKSNEIVKVKIGIKKKNYKEEINKTFLNSLIIDLKDLFKENYQNKKVLHMTIDRYLVDGISYPSLNNNLKGSDLCIELKFNFISLKFVSEISKILEKYQIKITEYLDREYIEIFFKDEEMKLCEMAYKIENGYNENEVKLIPKNTKNIGFFEKFFQLFS
tara:strand:+ start:437 stop:1141 length:705 start_codon:yes stop_codon:yes gene_type:complete